MYIMDNAIYKFLYYYIIMFVSWVQGVPGHNKILMIHMCVIISSYFHINVITVQIKLKYIFNKKKCRKWPQKCCCYSGKQALLNTCFFTKSSKCIPTECTFKKGAVTFEFTRNLIEIQHNSSCITLNMNREFTLF